MRKLVIGTVAFMLSLFSFTMCFYSLTPVFKTLYAVADTTMANQNLPAHITIIWNRAKSVFGLVWPAWGAMGVIFLIIWLITYLQKEDPYSRYVAGGPRV